MWLLGAPSPPPLMPLALDNGIRRRSPELVPPPLCLGLLGPPLEETPGALAELAAAGEGSLAVVVLASLRPRDAALSNWARRSALGLSLAETPRVL